MSDDDIRQGDWVTARPDPATTITGRLVAREASGLAALRLRSGQELLLECALERAPEHVVRALEGSRRVPRTSEPVEVLVDGAWVTGRVVEIRCGDTLHVEIDERIISRGGVVIVGVLIDSDDWRRCIG